MISKAELRKILQDVHKLGLTRTYLVSKGAKGVVVHHCEHGEVGADYNVYTRRWLCAEWPSDAALVEDVSLDKTLSVIKKKLGKSPWVLGQIQT